MTNKALSLDWERKDVWGTYRLCHGMRQINGKVSVGVNTSDCVYNTCAKPARKVIVIAVTVHSAGPVEACSTS